MVDAQETAAQGCPMTDAQEITPEPYERFGFFRWILAITGITAAILFVASIFAGVIAFRTEDTRLLLVAVALFISALWAGMFICLCQVVLAIEQNTRRDKL